jgi:hypothetical protein
MVHDFYVEGIRWALWRELVPKNQHDQVINEMFETLHVKTSESLKMEYIL